jgi:hypothetical protein
MLLLLSSPYYWACGVSFNEDSEKQKKQRKDKKIERNKERWTGPFVTKIGAFSSVFNIALGFVLFLFVLGYDG